MTETDESTQPDQAKETAFLDLISIIVRQFWHLIRGELALVRAETAQIVSRAVIGLLLGLFAILITLIALTQFAASLAAGIIALGLAPVWAHLCVGLSLLVIAAFMGWIASRKLRLSSLTPTRTLRNLELDAATIRPLWSKEGLSR